MGAEMTIGLTVTGLLPKGQPATTISGAKVGDVLILTKPIGSGTSLAAEMAGDIRGQDLVAMLHILQQPQSKAADLLSVSNAMTDVTGFGLAGHLLEICKASEVGAELRLSDISIYDGAIEMNRLGHRSSIYKDNASISDRFSGLQGEVGELLFDPQTSGGLLATVPDEQAEDVLAALIEAGYHAAIIGRVTDDTGQVSCV